MYSGTELDSTVKNVVQEIMREGTNKEIQITDSFVIYYVKLLMLDPTWGIISGALPNRNDVQRFVQFCLNKFEDQTVPSIITLKMQLYFMTNCDNMEIMVVKNRTDLKNRLSPLEKEIIETNTDIEDDIDKLYKKMIYLITLYSGLGNPTSRLIYEEAEAALKSIFFENDLKEFMARTPWSKEMQIVELTELVTGIRLFNRNCQKGGIGIEDLPKLLNQAIEATNDDIQRSLVQIMDNVNMFTTAIDNCYKVTEDSHGYILVLELPDGVLEQDLNYIKELLIVYRQYELFVRKILVEVGRIERISNDKMQGLENAYFKLHETVRFKIAIPTVQVFPLFVNVAHIWCDLQAQTISLSQLNQMLYNLQMYVKELSIKEDVLKLMIGPEGPLNDAERLERTTGLTIPPMKTEATVMDPSNIKDFDKVTLQYLGFCAWKFVETEGGLIPGNPNMGVLKIQGMYYIFSSPEAAVAFGSNPIRYFLRGLDLARNKPELINLLQLQDPLIAVQEIEELVVELPVIIETNEVDVQTDVHPIETKIDPNYMWNIWDWKRQAILLTNISSCLTHATQTIKSRAWTNVKSQTYETRDFTYQTKKDNYTNVPKLSNFIYGLRGRKDQTQHIVTLTRPVNE